MTPLKSLQQSFMGKMLGVKTPFDIETHIQSTPDTSAEARIGIYATGYRLRLKEALLNDYERLHSYLGDELFEQLMDAYIDRQPSEFTSLSDYGQHIGALLSDSQPYSTIPELLEIQHIEAAFNKSFNAADCCCVEISALAAVAPEAWPSVVLKFHASISILTAKHNSFPIWKALSEDENPPSLEADNTSWLVWRKELVSRFRALSEVEAMALQSMKQGISFAELCEILLNYYSEQDTPTQAVILLQTWINDQMICSIEHN